MWRGILNDAYIRKNKIMIAETERRHILPLPTAEPRMRFESTVTFFGHTLIVTTEEWDASTAPGDAIAIPGRTTSITHRVVDCVTGRTLAPLKPHALLR